MLNLLLVWILSSVALLITSRIVQNFLIKDFQSALIASVVLGLLNMTLKPILFLLTLPVNILTLGLFTFVINAVVLKFAATMLKGFDIKGWLPAIVGAVVLALVNIVIFWIFPVPY